MAQLTLEILGTDCKKFWQEIQGYLKCADSFNLDYLGHVWKSIFASLLSAIAAALMISTGQSGVIRNSKFMLGAIGL